DGPAARVAGPLAPVAAVGAPRVGYARGSACAGGRMLAVGDQPADFVLPDHQGNPVSWSDFRGRPVVVFFYPKASTPGCTKEACAFTDLAADFAARGVAVLGIS